MTCSSFKPSALLTGVALMLGAGTPTAGEVSAPSAESRYAMQGQRLERAGIQESADHRFRLDLQLEPDPAATTTGAEFELHARLFDAKAAACSSSADAIFANGFE